MTLCRRSDDEEEKDRFYAALEQPLQVLMTCSDGHGSPVLVHLTGTYKFLLEPKGGGAPTTSDLLRVQSVVRGCGGVGARFVQRLRVSSVSEDSATGKRRRDTFIEAEVHSVQQQRDVKKSLPLFRCLHLDPYVKSRSFEQPGTALYMARLGVQPGCYIVCEDGVVQDAEAASVPVVKAKGVRVVERTADMAACEPLTMGWDIETTSLSIRHGDICLISAAFFTTKIKAIVELGVCVRGREVMRSYMDQVFASGVPETHAVVLFASERDMVRFFLKHCMSRPIISWGYNSFKFDAPWMVAKSRPSDWQFVHWLPNDSALLPTKEMSSRAMNNNTFQLIQTLGIHDDLMLHAWKHCRFTPGNLSLNNVVFKTSGLSKAAYDHTTTQRVVRNPERYPLEYMKMVLYGGQDSALLLCLALPNVTAEDVLGPLGVTPDMLLEVLRVIDFRNLPQLVPELPPGLSIDQQRAWIERVKRVRCVYAEEDEAEGLADDLRMLPDGTRLSKSGSNADFWLARRGGLDGNTFILQVAALCKIPPAEVLPFGQQRRMTALVYINGVVGMGGLEFAFDAPAVLEDKGTFEGGAVEVLPAGIWGWCCYADASAMYPNLIRNHGLSPECPTGIEPELSHLREELLLPAIVSKLLAFRREKERLKKQFMGEYEESGDVYYEEQANFLAKQIAAMKGTINSIFGYCGSSTNSFGSSWHSIAESITRNGREQITAVKGVFNSLSFEKMQGIPGLAAVLRKHGLGAQPAFRTQAIYGDTDSKAAALVLESDASPAFHVSRQAAQELFEYVCDNMAELGQTLGVEPRITLDMGIEDLYFRILGCNQSKTYAGKVVHVTRGGGVEYRLIAKGLAVVRGDRYRIVINLQRECLNIALDEMDRATARDRILRRTYDTIRLVNEAGTQDFGKMSREAQALLPFVMLKVWGGQSADENAQSAVAHKMNRDGIMHVSSGEKVAFCIGPGGGNVKDRAFPVYEALSVKNPKGRRQCPLIVVDAIVSAVARVVAAVCSINNLKEAERVPFARHAKRMFRYFVIYHTRLWETQRAIEARRRKGYEYDSDEQEFISGIDEHLTRATDDLHKVTEYLLTKP